MILSDVFEQLFHVELSQTKLGIGTAVSPDEMDEANYPTAIVLINLGVLALHKRFALMEEEVVLQQYNSITTYYMDYAYAATNLTSTEPIKYLEDTAETPFNGTQFLRLLDIASEDGLAYLINPSHLEVSLETAYVAYTPTADSVQFPYTDDDNAVFITYKAAPTNIPITTKILTTEIKLPTVLLEALVAHIADRYFNSMKQDQKENIVYTNKYEIECQRIINAGLLPTEHVYSANRFRRNGWT